MNSDTGKDAVKGNDLGRKITCFGYSLEKMTCQCACFKYKENYCRLLCPH